MTGPRPKERLVNFMSSELHLRSWENEVTNLRSLEKDHNDLVKFGENDDDFSAMLMVLRKFEAAAMEAIPRPHDRRKAQG